MRGVRKRFVPNDVNMMPWGQVCSVSVHSR